MAFPHLLPPLLPNDQFESTLVDLKATEFSRFRAKRENFQTRIS